GGAIDGGGRGRPGTADSLRPGLLRPGRRSRARDHRRRLGMGLSAAAVDIRVVTLFPDRVAAVGEYGVVGRSVRRGLLHLSCINPRDYAQDAHRTVDDRPYGGGPGMVMKYEPLAAAVAAARAAAPDGAPVVCLTP